MSITGSVRTKRDIFRPNLLTRTGQKILCISRVGLLSSRVTGLLLTTLASHHGRVRQRNVDFRRPYTPLLVTACGPRRNPLQRRLLSHVTVTLSTSTTVALSGQITIISRADHCTTSPRKFLTRCTSRLSTLGARVVLTHR